MASAFYVLGNAVVKWKRKDLVLPMSTGEVLVENMTQKDR
jgi:hypothetical protein